MSELNAEEKEEILSRCRRLDNYCLLKVGIFAILSVYGLADFMNAGVLLRSLYAICWFLLAFYVYFLLDNKKFTARIKKLIK